MSDTRTQVHEDPTGSDTRRDAGATRGWDIAVGIAAVALLVFHMYGSRNFWFIFDDWAIVHRGDSIPDLFEPHNGHLSTLLVLLFRAQGLLFGLDSYFLIRLFGALSLVAIPAWLYTVARRSVPPAFAVLLALPFVMPPNIDPYPTAMNHWAAAAFAILLAGALQRDDRRSDTFVALWLSLSLLSAGGGVAAAVGAGVHTLCRRPSQRRWAAVLVPSVAWALWWTTQSSSDTSGGSLDLSGIAKGLWASFEFIGMQTAIGAVIVAAGFVAVLVLRCRHGLRAAASSIAWASASIVWWTALHLSRTSDLQGDLSGVFRYQMVGAVLIALALIPSQPGVAHEWIHRLTPEHRSAAVTATVGLVVVASIATIAVGLDDVRATQRTYEAWSRQSRSTLMTLVVEPPLVSGEWQYEWVPAIRTASELRVLAADVGHDFPSTALDLDERVVDEMVRLAPIDMIPRDCDASASVVDVPQGVNVVVGARTEAAVVEVRRFGERWIQITSLQPGEAARGGLPGLGSTTPWQLRISNGCVVTRGG